MIKLDPNETLILEARRHWFFLLLELLPLVPLIGIPILLILFSQTIDVSTYINTVTTGITGPPITTVPGNIVPSEVTPNILKDAADNSVFLKSKGDTLALGIFATAAWLLFAWIGAFVIWTDYYLDVLILTDKRIIDVEQKALFSREVSTFRLDRIQDVTIEIGGVVATFFGFGNLHVQTAGEDRSFVIHYVKDPERVKEQILQQHGIAIERLREVKIVGTISDEKERSSSSTSERNPT